MFPKRWTVIGWFGLAYIQASLAQVVGAMSAAQAVDCQNLANEFYTVELCPATIPPIARVEMNPPPPLQTRWPSEDCRTFRPRLSEIRRFWAQAGKISGQSYMHHLSVSACGARGTLVLKDGRKADWYVNAARMGTLSIEGEPESKDLYLFCPDCNFAPFWDWNTDEEFLPVQK